jgi:hypothetical protein
MENSIVIRPLFDAHADDIRDRFVRLRDLILPVGENLEATGGITETLKWGQPSYLPKRPRVGTTVRLGTLKSAPESPALFVHCQTRLIETFRRHYPDTFIYEGNRALLLRGDDPLPEAEIRHCVSLALTYHLWK